MNEVILILMLAILVEYMTNIVKNLIPETIYPLPLLISLIIGVGLALTVKVDILQSLGFQPVYEVVGYITTGLIVSGGSTAVHELISKLRASREDIIPEEDYFELLEDERTKEFYDEED